MKEWAKDEAHNGTYYISCPDITFQKSREEVAGNDSPCSADHR